MLELQAIADICFSVVECYSEQDFFMPMQIIYPKRYSQMPECKGRIRLWIHTNHCMALVDRDSQHLIQNISDDSDKLQAVSINANDEEEI